MYDELVSIIIPTYKRPGMIDRAILSALNQTYDNIEVIVVDDNNADSKERQITEEHMKKYDDNDRVRYITKEKNMGAPTCRNIGVREARGEFIAFLDDDDEFYPEKIEKQMESALNGFDIVVSGWELFYPNSGDKITILYKTIPDTKEEMLKNQLLAIKGISHTGTFLFKKKAFSDIGGFSDISATQDYELILRALGKGLRLSIVNEALQKTYIHEEFRITVNSKVIAAREKLLEIKKEFFPILSLSERNYVLTRDYIFILINSVRFKDFKRIVQYSFRIIPKLNHVCRVLKENRTLKVSKVRYI